MRKTVLVMRHEMLTTLRRKSYLFFALGLPLILGLVALVIMFINRDGSQAAEAEQETAVSGEVQAQGYVDLAGLVASQPPGIPPGSLLPFENETAAAAALTADEIAGYFIISADYLAGGELIYVTNEFNPFEGVPVARLVEWLLVTNLLQDPALATAVWQPLNVTVRQLEQPGAAEALDEENWIVELLPTLMVLIIYMTIIIPAGSLVNAVADEKKNRVIESVLVSVSSHQFITGKILALGLLGLLQIAMWIGVLYGVVTFGGQPLNIPEGFSLDTTLLFWVILYSLLGYAMYGVLMAGLGALVPDVKAASSASFILLMPLILAYMFNMVIVELPNGPIALILSFFPLTAPVAMIGRMAATEVPIWQGALSAVLQFAAAVVLLRLVARLFQAKYILSGQPFSIKRYFGALAGRV